MYEVVAPDRPLVVTRGFDGCHWKAFGFERGDYGPVGLEERIVYPAGHPEQPEIRLLRGGGRELRNAGGIQAGGKSADPGKQLRVGKTDEQALMAAHGKPGDSAVLALFGYVIVRLDLRNHFGEQCLLKKIDALRASGLEYVRA